MVTKPAVTHNKNKQFYFFPVTVCVQQNIYIIVHLHSHTKIFIINKQSNSGLFKCKEKRHGFRFDFAMKNKHVKCDNIS